MSWRCWYLKGADNTPYEKIGDEVRSLADEVPFDIPDSWEWVRLGELFQHNTGKALNAANRTGQLKQYITTSNLYWDRFELDNLKEMHFSESEVEKCTVIKGDLLVCEGGDIGRAAIWPFDYPMCIQNHIHRLRAYVPICTRFFYYLFDLYKHAGWIGGKGIGIQGLSSNAVHVLLFPLPPLAEQYRIVDAVDALQPYADSYAGVESNLDKLNTNFPERLKKSILQEAVQGKLVPQDPSDEPAEALLERIRAEKQRLIKEGKIKKDKHESVIFRRDNSHYEKLDGVERCIDDELPFEIPENWLWQRIPTISLSISAGGDKPSVFSKVKTEECSVPVYSNGEKDDGLFGYTDVAKVFDKSVTISGRGTIGFSCVRNEPYVPIVRLITVVPCAGIDLQYLHFVFTALFEQGVGTSIQQLTVPMLQVKLIPVPPLVEQHRIVQRIEELLPLVKGL